MGLVSPDNLANERRRGLSRLVSSAGSALDAFFFQNCRGHFGIDACCGVPAQIGC